MGRYLANGVVVNLQIVKRENGRDLDISKQKDKIILQLSKFLNMENYSLEEYDNGYEFTLKKDFFDNHIHELIREINPITDCRECLFYSSNGKNYKDIKVDENFNKKNYPIELCLYDDSYNYQSDWQKDKMMGNFYMKIENEEVNLTEPFFPSNVWLIADNRELFDNFKVYISFAMLWSTIDKVSFEDDSTLLFILNHFARKTLTSPLSKNLLFFIEG